MASASGPEAVTTAAGVVQRAFPDALLRQEQILGDDVLWVRRESLVDVARLLRDDPDTAFKMPVFVTAVDWPDREPEEPRFDVVYELRSHQYNRTCRVIVQVTDDDPHVPSLEGVWPGMDWHERECFDLLGIVFDGHHNLQRILLPVDWDGHPLRKDYVSFGEPIAFTHNLEWALPEAERPRDLPGEHR